MPPLVFNMVEINKKNIDMYKCILSECTPKKEILKYIVNRLKKIRKAFDRDVFIKNNGIIYNCGRVFENCTIVCSFFEDYIQKEFDINEGIFIDVGAHIGKHSLYVAKRLDDKGKVFSIEANKENAELLRKNALLNNLENINVYETICLDREKEIVFFQDEFHTATNSIYEKEGKIGVKKTSQKLDNLFPNIKNVKLIKIDVEGAENLVILGAKKIIKENKPKIIFESWNGEQLDSIKKGLESLGYTIRHVKEDNYVAEIN